ncbi:MAG: hypothetical protein FWD13_08110, partial [Treponema sp.]|nr:hypothetical protein [Treponema sp.]
MKSLIYNFSIILIVHRSLYSHGRQRARRAARLVAGNPPMELQSFFIIKYSLITDNFFLCWISSGGEPQKTARRPA